MALKFSSGSGLTSSFLSPFCDLACVDVDMESIAFYLIWLGSQTIFDLTFSSKLVVFNSQHRLPSFPIGIGVTCLGQGMFHC